MKRKPLGKPLPLTAAQLEQLALITPQDIEEAKSAARKHGGERFVAMLEAQKQDESN